MKDGSDAVSDWPLLNALLNCASGASWVSFHHGGGVGIGFSQHAGMASVAAPVPDRRPLDVRAARKPERREVDVSIDFVGFRIGDVFVAGYGIDHAEKNRHLPYIGVVD
jgi:hypothetical protein